MTDIERVYAYGLYAGEIVSFLAAFLQHCSWMLITAAFP